MVTFSAKYVVKFVCDINVELHARKMAADCEVYFGVHGQVIKLEVILKGMYEGRKYTTSMSDSSMILSRARTLYDSGHAKPNNSDIDMNDDSVSETIRKNNLISSRSFTRTDRPKSIEKPNSEPVKTQSATRKLEAIEPKTNSVNKYESTGTTLEKIRELICKNNNNITISDICDKINVSKSTVQDVVLKLGVVRNRDLNYKGKGRRFLLSIEDVNNEYQPHSAG
jgi:hypothetical protein